MSIIILGKELHSDKFILSKTESLPPYPQPLVFQSTIKNIYSEDYFCSKRKKIYIYGYINLKVKKSFLLYSTD